MLCHLHISNFAIVRALEIETNDSNTASSNMQALASQTLDLLTPQAAGADGEKKGRSQACNKARSCGVDIGSLALILVSCTN